MSSVTRSLLAASIAAISVSVVAQGNKFPQVPLNDKRFEYNQLPYKVDTDVGLERGVQYGYNICNSTTTGAQSKCQTAIINSIDDFCLWGPPDPDSLVGNTEGEAVAWCTDPSHGTRTIPPGALQGVQFMKTPDYIQVVGFIDQTKINMRSDDYGGEMDPHGADLRGNPMGGLLYSKAWSSGGDFKQVIQWHNFMGANFFCLKACDPSKPNDRKFCEHIFDRIGCAYNAPNKAQNGTFESCMGDNQDFPGVYTQNGQVMTYTQPPEELGVIATMPYQPKVPASSQCTQYQSQTLYAKLGTVSTSASASAGKPTGSGSGSGLGGGTQTGTGQRAQQTGGAVGVRVGVGMVVLGFVGVFLLA
ncbi:hypothetical protein E1B28_003707 [Marasmius oreades]|uniref:Macrofage activating glycoprotein n=1 Tax=Marasmius oreades TaxID=181124 RepID=A0A9P7UX36_9AGAR|nr:uncharacterized protein E1B28_003707 [Marasmius oreades]KAG7096259.1 hypothetical protein E1B28_003707 [Marasmius oreades]